MPQALPLPVAQPKTRKNTWMRPVLGPGEGEGNGGEKGYPNTHYTHSGGGVGEKRDPLTGSIHSSFWDQERNGDLWERKLPLWVPFLLYGSPGWLSNLSPFTPLHLTWDISSLGLYPCSLETVFILSVMVFLPTKSKLGYETMYLTLSKLHQPSQQENGTLPRRLNTKGNLWFHHLSRIIWQTLFILTWRQAHWDCGTEWVSLSIMVTEKQLVVKI